MNDTSSDPNDTRLGSAGEEPDPYQLAADAAYQNLTLMTPMFVPLFYIPMAVATLPGEVRMYARIMNRGWPNVSELVFWFLKYIYLAHALCFTLVMWGGPGYVTAASCFNMWWFSKWAMYTAATLVTLTCALRAYVILGRERKIGIALLVALMVHYGMGMGLAATDVNMDNYWGGYCFTSEDTSRNLILLTVYLGYSCVLDLAMVVPPTIKLVRSSISIRSMHKTTKLLFEHSVHYVFTVTAINLFQLIFGQADQSVENFTVAAITAQTVLALFQIIAEQDSVNGYVGFRGEDFSRTTRGGPASWKGSPVLGGGSRLRSFFSSSSGRTPAKDEELPIPMSNPRGTAADVGVGPAACTEESIMLSVPGQAVRRNTKSSGVSEQGKQGEDPTYAASESSNALGVSNLTYEVQHP